MEDVLVEPRASTIVGAGMGLFAKKLIPKDTVIVEYSGRVLDLEQAKVLRDRMYLKAVTLNRHIDAKGPDGSLAKYINDHVSKERHNASFFKKDTRVFIRALRNIQPGEELFVSYGRGHWLFVGSADFLGLRKESSQLFVQNDMNVHEVVCCLSSPAMADVDKLGEGITFAEEMDDPKANCRLKPNMFVKDTVMVVATKAIGSGDAIIVRAEDRLAVGISGIPDAELGVFARVHIKKGSCLGRYSGNLLADEITFQNRIQEAPSARKYIVKDLRTGVFLDPTDKKGQIRPFHVAGVFFINHSDTDPNSEIRENLTVFALRDIPKGQEVLTTYKHHFLGFEKRK